MTQADAVTFCTICEASCGLRVRVDGDRVVDVKPDSDHVISRGFACIKGTAVGALHHDPDRLRYPMKRVGGELVRISWEQAIAEIGKRVRSLRKTYGDHTVGAYAGNPSMLNYKHLLFSQVFTRSLGSPNFFVSHSIDCNNKLYVAKELYGHYDTHPMPDLRSTKLLLLFGANPVVTQMSFATAPNSLERLRAIERRGGRVITIDPVRSETAKRVGSHLRIVPGTDAYLLMAMTQEIFASGMANLDLLRRHTEGWEQVSDAVMPWSPERVAKITGISAAQIRQLAHEFATTDGASIYMSTGVNMSPFGTLAYWLIQVLAVATGNLDRTGGFVVPRGPFNAARVLRLMGLGRKNERSEVGQWPAVADAFPTASLAQHVLDAGDSGIRALFITGGNPAHSVPGRRIVDALKGLDLLVCIDIYPSETTQLADYVLPATDLLERSNFTLSTTFNQDAPYLQYSEPVVSPAYERREEWQILSELALACGAPLWNRTFLPWVARLNRLLSRLPGQLQITPDHLLAFALRVFGSVRLTEVRAAVHGLLLKPNKVPFLGGWIRTPSRRVHLAPAALLDDIARLATEVPQSSPDKLVLLGRRERRTHNSWMHNNPGIRQPSSPTAWIHPKDARQIGIESGDDIELQGEGERFALPAKLTTDVARGVVVVPHGWGHHGSGLTRAAKLGGGNVNRLSPDAVMDPVSGQAVMVGFRVQVRRAKPAGKRCLPQVRASA